MKLAALKTYKLAAVRSKSKKLEPAANEPSPLKDFFSGWLDSVAPGLSRQRGQLKSERPRYRNRPITQTDMVRVNRATVRESTDHRHWPPEVVAQFLAAEVIRNKGKST